MSLQAPHPSTPRMMHVAASAHALAAVLLVVGRAGYGGRPRGLIGDMADNPWWALIHLAAAAALLASTHHPDARTWAAWLSAFTMTVWSVLLLWWAANLEPDGTWLAGTFGLVVAAISTTLATRED